MGFLKRVLGGKPVQRPHEDPELESALPAAVAGRSLERWSVRGERAFASDGQTLSARDADGISQDLTEVGLSFRDVSHAIAGRASAEDPPYLIQAWRFGDRPATDLQLDLTVDHKGLGGWKSGMLGGRAVARGTVEMIQQTKRARGRPYVLQSGPVQFSIATDDERWAEEVCTLLPATDAASVAGNPRAAVERALVQLAEGEGQFAICEVPGDRNVYAQVHVGKTVKKPLHGEIVGNEYLGPTDRLGDAGQARLIAAGWTADRSGVGNYWREWPAWTEESARSSVARDILDGLGVFGSTQQNLWIEVAFD